MSAFESDDAREGELFLRLPSPRSHIILTQPRGSDMPAAVGYLNDIQVSQWLSGPPYPYREEDWHSFNPQTITDCAKSAQQYKARDVEGSNHAPWLETLPVRSIRDTQATDHVLSDGGQLYLGDIAIRRASFSEVLDPAKRKELREANYAYEPGDKRILWVIGDYLAPSHWGKGIMSGAVKVVIEAAKTFLNAHTIQISYFSENVGSRKVFERCGFVPFGTVTNAVTHPPSKGGKTFDLGLMRWYRSK